MTLAGRLKLAVIISSLFLVVMMGILSYIMYLDNQGYNNSYRYQELQITLSQLSGELWQLRQYEDFQALERAIDLSLTLDAQLLELNQQQNAKLGHIEKANTNLRTLMGLYPRTQDALNSENLNMLMARINTILLSMQDEVGELRHQLVARQHEAKKLMLVVIALLLFMSKTVVILFNLNTLKLFRRGLDNLESGIRQLASGDMASKVPEEVENPEFTTLSQHFNRMKQELKDSTISRADLQDEVNKRTELLQLQKEKLKYEAEHDPLTQVYSRNAFARILEQSLKRLQRNGGTGALLFIDINKFKPINDNYGHNIGDHVLITVARRIAYTLRQSDMISRLGGDEFVVWLEPIESPNQLDVVVEKLLDKLHQDIGFQNVHLLIDVSIGVAFYPEDGSNIEALLEVADKNMYACKRGAPKGYVSSSPR
ncbi:diguanylate cyclase [Shewanella khirikhana]|uniref:diguanylate cyclase domain-containing protein n=1 Tax=Shewanella khirikhana TaxID=1965282 RepID=UPI0030D3F992